MKGTNELITRVKDLRGIIGNLIVCQHLKLGSYTFSLRLKITSNNQHDSDAYDRYMARKAKQEKDDEVRKVIRDVNEIKKEMFEIKDLLKKVIDGR